MAAFSFAPRRRGLAAILGATPVLVMFVSSNIVNAGNLAFNVVFSRWMGPELFGQLASLLTIKLAILGILGALQMAVSQRASAANGPDDRLDAALFWFGRLFFVALWLALPVVLSLVFWADLHLWLGLGSAATLIVFCLSLPFAVPLSLLRGLAIGRLNVRAMAFSANIEMGVRLIGGIVAWQMGGGLAGVVLAISVSIMAGCLPLARLLPRRQGTASAWPYLKTGVIAASVPFALLQVAQVILLDADVFVARALLGSTEAGYVAALNLFQRIQFFACFGLAGVLLPAVTTAVAKGECPLVPALNVLTLFAVVSVMCLGGAALAPEQVMSVLVGEAFLQAAPALWPMALAAAAFTLSYLAATFLMALGDRWGIWVMLVACPLQIVAMAATPDTVVTLMNAKLFCQLVVCLLIFARAIRQIAKAK